VGRSTRPGFEQLEDRTLPTFVAAPMYPLGPKNGAGSKPVAVVRGDFNHDGILDVVTANQGTNNISLLLGIGNGTFRPAINFPLPHAPAALLAADLNGDGRLDLVTANQSDDSISVLLNNGAGSFRAPSTFSAGAGPVAVAAGDFNGDGHTDLAVADNAGNTVTVFLGEGTGTFMPPRTLAVGGSPTSIVAADFTHDGAADIATVSGSGVEVNLNNGDGTFAPLSTYPTGGTPNALVVGDFNHDGNPDLAVACGFPSHDGVSVLLGNAGGTFQTVQNYSAGGQTPVTLAVGDLNGDGVQDLITANGQFANNSVSVLSGIGDGSFATPSVYAAGQTPIDVAVGDFNGDGMLDVVAANQGAFMGTQEGSVSVLLGNGDGSLMASPDLIVPGPGPIAEADLTGDGIRDLAVVTTSVQFSGITVCPGLGNGAFGTPVPAVHVNQAAAIAVADFNGDDNEDLAVASPSGVSIFLGNGNGTFGTPQVFAAGPSPAWIAVGDFNGDGILDLAVADNSASGSVSILLGNSNGNGKGDGTFQPASNVSAGGAATYVATGDFNSDHIVDLAVVNKSSAQVSVVFGKGDGTFGSPTAYATQVGPGSVGVGDFNGDHKLDLAVPTFFGSALTLLQNKGTGAFGLGTAYATDSRPIGIAVADFNGDGRLDIATVNDFADNLFVFPGTGTGTFGAPAAYVVGDRPTWVTAADFNGDGLPGLAVVNSNSGTVTLLEAAPATAAHFRVRVATSTATAGGACQIIVTALDSENRLMPGYTGTVSFTSSDGAATLPAAYKFTAADRGVHRFTFTLRTAGAQNIVAHAGAASGSGTVNLVAAPASHLQVTAAPATAGTPFDVTVTARDPYGNVDTNFSRPVHFSTSDPAKGASVPGDYTFTASDNGVHTFVGEATLLTAGTDTITATDPPTTGPYGSTTVAVQAAAASQLFISAPTSVTAGTLFTVTVTARDPYSNVATGFLGTVGFTSSDGNAALPADYAFTPADKGVHTFLLQATLKTAGPQSLTVSGASCTSGQQNGIQVKPGAAAQALVIGQPANTFIATPITTGVTVQVEDTYGNPVAAGVHVTLALANNPSTAGLSGTSALTAGGGVATFRSVAVSKAGQGYTLVAHAGTGLSTPSSPFTVYAATHFGLSLSSTQAQAGTSFQVIVTALDAANHADPTYVGTIHFSSTVPAALASVPSDYPFQASDQGQQTFSVTLNKAGLQTMTVADRVKPAAKGSANVTIAPAAASVFAVTGYPLSTLVNAPHSFTVIAEDIYGNTVTSYAGTVQFSEQGGTAVLPAPYHFTTLDKGRHVFTATFQSVGGDQSLTVADQTNSADTGTESGITVKAS
jgi:hypothetical protein